MTMPSIVVPVEWIRIISEVERTTTDEIISYQIKKVREELCIPRCIEKRDLELFTIPHTEWPTESVRPSLIFRNHEDLVYFKLKYL